MMPGIKNFVGQIIQRRTPLPSATGEPCLTDLVNVRIATRRFG